MCDRVESSAGFHLIIDHFQWFEFPAVCACTHLMTEMFWVGALRFSSYFNPAPHVAAVIHVVTEPNDLGTSTEAGG